VSSKNMDILKKNNDILGTELEIWISGERCFSPEFGLLQFLVGLKFRSTREVGPNYGLSISKRFFVLLSSISF
jgi:hypothetical protein